jgi:hypothetical protein
MGWRKIRSETKGRKERFGAGKTYGGGATTAAVAARSAPDAAPATADPTPDADSSGSKTDADTKTGYKKKVTSKPGRRIRSRGLYPKGFHLSVKVASFNLQLFGCLRDVIVIFLKSFEDKIFFKLITGFPQCFKRIIIGFDPFE